MDAGEQNELLLVCDAEVSDWFSGWDSQHIEQLVCLHISDFHVVLADGEAVLSVQLTES